MDPFAVLGIAPAFAVDLAAAEKTHRELSRVLHPDRYASAPPTERRAALARAVEVNEAWRIVRDPVRRAEALFAREGVAVGEDREPKPAPALLMEVMELREGLAEARAGGDQPRIRVMEEDVRRRAAAAEGALAEAFPSAAPAAEEPAPARRGALVALLPRLGEMRFYRRFLEEVRAAEEETERTA